MEAMINHLVEFATVLLQVATHLKLLTVFLFLSSILIMYAYYLIKSNESIRIKCYDNASFLYLIIYNYVKYTNNYITVCSVNEVLPSGEYISVLFFTVETVSFGLVKFYFI